MSNSKNSPQNKNIAQSRQPLMGKIETQELYSGPIPHPDFLKKFGDVDPSFPERIMKMAEDNNKADVVMRNRFSRAGLIAPLLGQIFSFLISCIGFTTAILFGLKGIEAGAITATIGGIAPIIIAALTNIKTKQQGQADNH
jgi:uncharacterized membrane protein